MATVLLEEKPEAASATHGGPLVERTFRCTGGCGRVRTFVALTMQLVAQQVAAAGWKIDPMHDRAECPDCWMAYEVSVLRGARGNT